MVNQGLALPGVNKTRRERIPFSAAEKRTLLLGINTIGFNSNSSTYQRILAVGKANNVFLDRRTEQDLSNLFTNLRNKGYARFPGQKGQDCFTEAAREEFLLVKGEQDPAFL